MNTESLFTGRKAVTLLALSACLLWGSAFPAVKSGYALLGIAAGDTPAQLLFAGCRFTLAGFLVLALAALGGQNILSPRGRDWRQLFQLGLVMTTAQYIFFYIGLAHTGGVKASIINSANTFFSVILSHFIYANDRLNPNTVIGCLLGFAGVVAVNWGGGAGVDFQLLGEGFLVISCLCMAVAGIMGKGLSSRLNPVLMTGWQLTLGGLLLTVSGLALGGRLPGFNPASGALLGYLALLSAAAFAIYATLLKYNNVSRVTIFNFTIPFFGAVLSAIFLDEKLLSWKYVLALVLVCAGIWLVTARRS